ncbi:cytochrome P450 [Amycolatopsis sp. WQ 127309]|uniref:cytochrome P450 n=1 Tax=Amycolatopsis sp. WQ 127309 TaxID=2932773 RepID=UPI001FF3AAA2|nr:cytochrome P450 [Amycolatopsis sp. WQ 127309]UOZ07001.1 cytochrome P450 [Amycolatopsis sp. WQ 127309]
MKSTRPNPYPLLAELREQSPFVVDGSTVVLARYADCEVVLRDRTSSSDHGKIVPDGVRPPKPYSFLYQDGAEHTTQRRAVADAFGRAAVGRWQELIRETTEECLERAAGRGEMDLVQDLALQIPMRLAFHLLGIPEGDRPKVQAWVFELGRYIDVFGLRPADIAESARVNTEVDDYFIELLRLRRREPGTDLLSRMAANSDIDDPVVAKQLAQTLKLIAVAGMETTVNLISSTCLALMRNPAQLELLRSDLDLVPDAVEETLRYDPPLHLLYRTSTRDLEVRGVPIAEGTRLMVLLGATGRDPEVHLRPDEYDVVRPDKTHLGFGAGPHFCLGAGLARMEVTTVVHAFAERVIAPELRTDRLRYRPHVTLRGLAELPIRFRAVR